jgi:peptidoglycan/xylan/chitin deacetylase (PgdA/CDA1 family)
MALLVLMYHRARSGPLGNAPAMLDDHFGVIAGRHACVLPGETLDPRRLNVCITFDDAYFDFYAVVFPLLKKHGLRALLAVPPVLVPDRVAATAEARLQMEPGVKYGRQNQGGFCTWSELREMAWSGHVDIASHSLTHSRLTGPGVDLQSEVETSRHLLATRLDRPVDSFVFPYGAFDRAVLHTVRCHCRHAFRIGGADNPGWDREILYRVDADRMDAPGALFAPARLTAYRCRRFWNRLRRR